MFVAFKKSVTVVFPIEMSIASHGVTLYPPNPSSSGGVGVTGVRVTLKLIECGHSSDLNSPSLITYIGLYV
jgi:hypothetical protein